ncbi:MAG TPA: hypothetical protein VNA14_09025 [Mycobacteriales bacterium]|nr:hypothetical protein [Mycobacteriales bacterium]
MPCATCQAELPGSTRFCPGCGSPGQVAVQTQTLDIGSGVDLSAAPGSEPYPGDPPTGASRARTGRRRHAADDQPAGATTVLAQPEIAEPAQPPRRPLAERLGPAADVLRGGADRFGSAPLEVRIAAVGALITVLSFLLLPLAEGFGAPVELSGRLWWRPIAAVAAAVLVAASVGRPASADGADVPRRTDGLLAAVVIAAAGVAEAGLLALLAGDVARPRAGFYGMLLGLVVVLFAAVRAARRTLR